MVRRTRKTSCQSRKSKTQFTQKSLAVKAKINRDKENESWEPFMRVPVAVSVGDPAVDPKMQFENNNFIVKVYVHEEGVTDWNDTGHPMVYLSFRRQNNRAIRDWRDVQRIKNELCGTTCEAMEIYPNEDRLSDAVNQFHIFVLPPGDYIPVGWHRGRWVSHDEGYALDMEKVKEKFPQKDWSTIVQRKFEEHHKTEGCAEIGPVWKALGHGEK